MTIDWKNAPEGATHYIHVQSDLIFFKIKSDAVFCFSKSGGWKRSVVTAAEALRDPDYVAIPRPTPTAIPELKKLTQAVFNKLPDWVVLAVINDKGQAIAARNGTKLVGSVWHIPQGDYFGMQPDALLIGEGYDATDWQNSLIEREEVTQATESDSATQAELSALRTQAIADAARIAELEASLAARGEALDFMKGAQQEWYEMYMQKRDAISRFKAGLVRAGARVPIDAMTMNANEQGLTAALVYLESELDRAAKRKYDLASIVSRGEQDDEN